MGLPEAFREDAKSDLERGVEDVALNELTSAVTDFYLEFLRFMRIDIEDIREQSDKLTDCSQFIGDPQFYKEMAWVLGQDLSHEYREFIDLSYRQYAPWYQRARFHFSRIQAERDFIIDKVTITDEMYIYLYVQKHFNEVLKVATMYKGIDISDDFDIPENIYHTVIKLFFLVMGTPFVDHHVYATGRIGLARLYADIFDDLIFSDEQNDLAQMLAFQAAQQVFRDSATYS